jgi:hypothetical protein
MKWSLPDTQIVTIIKVPITSFNSTIKLIFIIFNHTFIRIDVFSWEVNGYITIYCILLEIDSNIIY